VLRVGLTGGLGSGKSTVACYLRELGAHVIEADELGRALMEPGQAVFAAIVGHFGKDVLSGDGRLNRARLAELAFREGRLQELNAIVHPAAIAEQRHVMTEIFRADPGAVAVVESALIFEVERDARARGEVDTELADWRRRIDRIIVVIAPDEMKIARYAARISPDEGGRAGAAAQARRPLIHQIPDSEKAARADFVLENSGDKEALKAQVVKVWQRLTAESNKSAEAEF
jgi:dephospho-CoA kinase